ncbi:MAG: Rnf-Nqr domain containing protein [Pseudomonadota bacterium]
MTTILQALLGLVLVNHLMFDVVTVGANKSTASRLVLGKALFIARTTAAVFLVTLFIASVLEKLVLVHVANRLLSTLVFVVLLATVLQVIAILMVNRTLLHKQSMGLFLLLIFFNCVIMGVTLPVDINNMTLIDVFASGVARCAGFALLLVLFTTLRTRLAGADIPAALRGAPATLLAVALLSMTFMGFAGLI